MSITAAAIVFFLSATAPQNQYDASGDPQQNTAGAMFARISELEEQNRKLKGKLEEMEFKFDQLETENLKLQTELKTAKNEASAAKAAVPKPKIMIEPVTEDEDEPLITPKPVIAQASPNADFEKSFSYMTDGNIDEGKKGFEAFVKKYPGSSLSGEAYYWLGEMAFDEQDYNTAAINYLKGYREYPKGAKAPENILKLALTLKELGKVEEACQNLQRFNTEFKTAHTNLLAKAASHRQALKCK